MFQLLCVAINQFAECVEQEGLLAGEGDIVAFVA